jgi:hypothetical protein
VAETVVVDDAGARIDARAPGFATRFGTQDLAAIPARRFSSFDLVKTAPGISPTSPTGGNVLVSALGSGVDQNQSLIDGTKSLQRATASRARIRASTSFRNCRQDLHEAHHEVGGGQAIGSKRSRGILVKSRDALSDQAARRDPTTRRVGTGSELRSSDGHRFADDSVGSARGKVQLRAGHVPDVGRSDHRESG